jgi:hypothetical protein
MLDLDPNARDATFDPRRHVLMVWDTIFERTAMTCDTLEQAKALVAQTGIPQTLRMLLQPVYRR